MVVAKHSRWRCSQTHPEEYITYNTRESWMNFLYCRLGMGIGNRPSVKPAGRISMFMAQA